MFDFCVILVESAIPLCIWETQLSKVRPAVKKSSGFHRLWHGAVLFPPGTSSQGLPQDGSDTLTSLTDDLGLVST